MACVLKFEITMNEISPQYLHASRFCTFIKVHIFTGCSAYLDRWIEQTATFVLYIEVHEWFSSVRKIIQIALHWKFQNQFIFSLLQINTQHRAIFTLFYLSGVLLNTVIILTTCHTFVGHFDDLNLLWNNLWDQLDESIM